MDLGAVGKINIILGKTRLMEAWEQPTGFCSTLTGHIWGIADRKHHKIIYPNIYRECNQYFVCVLFKRTKGFISESLFYVENGIPSLNLPTSLALRCELRCDHE